MREQLTAAEAQQVIKWATDTLQNGGIDKFTDLHLDEINPRFADRRIWALHGADLLFEVERHIRPDIQAATLALAFSLETVAFPQGVDFRNVDAFVEQVDHSPPSLYLFWKGREPWVREYADTHTRIEKFNMQLAFGDHARPDGACYLTEFRQPGNDEYYRTVFLTQSTENSA